MIPQKPIHVWAEVQAFLGIDSTTVHYIVVIGWVLHALEALWVLYRCVKIRVPIVHTTLWTFFTFLVGGPCTHAFVKAARKQKPKVK